MCTGSRFSADAANASAWPNVSSACRCAPSSKSKSASRRSAAPANAFNKPLVCCAIPAMSRSANASCDTLKLDYRFAHEAFADRDIAGIAQQTSGLLNAFAGAADRLLADFDLLDGAQRQALLTLGHADALAASAENLLPVHMLIEAREQQQQDALALVAGHDSLSYGELNARANRLAHRLMREGVGPEVRVGFAVARSAEMIVGLLAVLKAGGAYVPLDPAYPVERLAHMAADSGITLLITQSHLHGRLPAEVGLKRLDLDTLDVSAEPASNPSVKLAGGNLVYVIYTSGSTGKPKGVAVAHDALSMHCQAIATRYGITPERSEE